ncbi:hypothetical protein NMG60_11028171 [Bertholletia excelsa]
MELDANLIGEYIARGASLVVLSDAIFDKVAMDQSNFDQVRQLAQLSALLGHEAVQRRPQPSSPVWLEDATECFRQDKVIQEDLFKTNGIRLNFV